MNRNNGRIILKEFRDAEQNECFEYEALMSCLRTEEYKNIVLSLGESLEGVAGYDMYKYCYQVISKANPNKLREFFCVKLRNAKIIQHYYENTPCQLDK